MLVLWGECIMHIQRFLRKINEMYHFFTQIGRGGKNYRTIYNAYSIHVMRMQICWNIKSYDYLPVTPSSEAIGVEVHLQQMKNIRSFLTYLGTMLHLKIGRN